MRFLMLVLFMATCSFAATVKMMNGNIGNVILTDTNTVFNKSESKIPVRNSYGESFLNKSEILFVVIGADTIRFRGDIAVGSNGEEIGRKVSSIPVVTYSAVNPNYVPQVIRKPMYTDEYQPDELESKVYQFSKMRKSGIGMLAGSSALCGLGLIIVATSSTIDE